MDALKQASQLSKPKTRSLPSSSSLKDLKKGYLNGIGDSMFVVKGVSKRRPPLNLKVLLDTRADRPYVSQAIALQIGELKEGQPVLIDLPSSGNTSSNERVRVLVRIGTYRLAVKCVVIDLSGYNLVLGETWF